jgi:TolB-like protein/Flp pilus assembly protein TadD
VAVLPFENLGAAEDAYFADGMTDEVRSKLAGLPGLAVIAGASTTQYKGTTKPPREIAQELDARYLLTAKVRWQKTGDVSRIRVTPELVEVSGDGAPTTRWQDAFDADLEDVFEVQGQIATRVARALELALGSEQQGQLEERPTSNLAAWDAYLKGREITDSGNDATTLRRAMVPLEQAVALDPDFALAWAYLSAARSLAYANGVPSSDLAESALEAARRAMALAPDRAESYWALGSYRRLVERDFARAVEVFRGGLGVSPGDVNLLRGVGLALMESGQLEPALDPLRRAQELDPRSFRVSTVLGDVFMRLRRPREAREAYDRALALAPAHLDILKRKVRTHLDEGDVDGARAVVASAAHRAEPTALVATMADYAPFVLDESQRDLVLRLTPAAFADDRATWALTLAQELQWRGDTEAARPYWEEARDELAKQLEASPDTPALHASYGLTLAFLGSREEAVRGGERAVELAPVEEDAFYGPGMLTNLMWIHMQLGDHEEALDLLERALQVPGGLTRALVRVDPDFEPLRGNPRFEALLKG